MKKLLLMLLSFKTIFCIEWQSPCIVDYQPSHKDSVMEICFQDPYKFFGIGQLISANTWSIEHFNQINRQFMETVFADSLRVKKVIIESGTVVGFVEFFKTQEESLESIKEMNMPLEQEAQLVAMMPNLKKTDAECEPFALLECLMISRDFRGRGYARALLKKSIDCIKHEWPMIVRVALDVNVANQTARKLYESEGFMVAVTQPLCVVMMGDIRYEKAV